MKREFEQQKDRFLDSANSTFGYNRDAPVNRHTSARRGRYGTGCAVRRIKELTPSSLLRPIGAHSLVSASSFGLRADYGSSKDSRASRLKPQDLTGTKFRFDSVEATGRSPLHDASEQRRRRLRRRPQRCGRVEVRQVNKLAPELITPAPTFPSDTLSFRGVNVTQEKPGETSTTQRIGAPPQD